MSEVDPRVCGGGSFLYLLFRHVQGRSPRMRGRHRGRSEPTKKGGSIPAYAGEASADANQREKPRVDPRVCGGGFPSMTLTTFDGGRSPRMRGRQWSCSQKKRVLRSIPAYAGEAPPQRGLGSRRRVDPRVCGGGRHFSRWTITAVGRSPRMRGRLGGKTCLKSITRSIPAYAGEAQKG